MPQCEDFPCCGHGYDASAGERATITIILTTTIQCITNGARARAVRGAGLLGRSAARVTA